MSLARSNSRVLLGMLIIMVMVLLPLSNVSAQNQRLSVVASTTIIADVVRNVAGDAADVISLMEVGQDPHSFEASGSDIALLDEADLVFVNGAGFEGNLLSIVEEAVDADHLYQISICVEILPFGDSGLAHDHDHDADEAHDHDHDADEAHDHDHDADEAHDHDHDADEAHDHDHDADEAHDHASESLATWCAEHDHELASVSEESHSHDEAALGRLYEVHCEIHVHDHDEEVDETHHVDAGGCDPHIWTSVHNAMYWTLFARDVLSEHDPANREVYAANAAAYLEQLSLLDAELEALVESLPAEQRILVTNHEALGYLAHEYGFEVVGTVIPSISTTAEPSAGDIANLIEVIEDYGVSAIFSENTTSETLASQIASETGTAIFKLYTDSLTDASGDAPTYIDLMRYNVSTIVNALAQ